LHFRYSYLNPYQTITNPYDPIRRIGGTLVLLYHYDGATDNFIPTRPTAIGSDYLQYPYTLPTPTELPQLRRFVVAIPKITTVSCEAVNPLSGQTITSNSLTLLLKAPAYQLGPWTIRDAINDAGASIGTATYLTVDKMGQFPKNLPLIFSQGAYAEGDLLQKSHLQFPSTPFYKRFRTFFFTVTPASLLCSSRFTEGHLSTYKGHLNISLPLSPGNPDPGFGFPPD